MAISSDHVIREVSKKLKYYFDVKRLEDGFDLSGVACPRLDHPPTKARPTLLYDGLHDRPLKHYFSPQQVKSALTQFKQPQGKNSREKEIRRQLERYFRRYQFNENAAKPDTRTVSTSTPSLGGTSAANGRPRKSRPTRSAKSGQSRSQQPVLSDGYYNTHKGSSRKLKPEASGGFGVGLKKRKGAFRGGQPVLRSAPPNGTSRHETERLVNIASRLLVATETIDLKNPPTGKYQGQGHREKDENRGAPRNFESGPRGRHSIYTYDTNGRRILLRRRSETPPRSPTPPGNYVTITGEQADDQVMPHWLQKKVAEGGAGDPDRPQSAYGSPSPRPPDEDSRPQSAAVIRPRPKRTSSESEPGRPGQAKQGWGSNSSMEVGAQTDGALLKNYDPSEVILEEGERTLYEVHVVTGTRLGASTKANIKMALFGDKGRTKDIYLEQSSTYKIKFQKGQKDIFKLDTFHVGPIKKIAIGHDRNELGYGWYLERVEVRDTERRLLYSIPCERWLSSQDSEKRTYREFDVEYNTSYNPETPRSPEPPSEPAPEPQDASPRTDRSHTSYSSDSSHTSVDTNYSERSKRSDRSSSKGKRTPPRQRSYTSQSSEYTSSTVSSARRLQKKSPRKGGKQRQKTAQGSRSSRSSSPRSTPRKPIQEEPAEDEKKATEEEPKAKPAPLARPLQRRDTFFDQRTAGPDYTSVLDSLSTTTEDRRDSQDFDQTKPLYAEKDPTGKPLTLIEDEETARLEGDAVDKQADREEEERVGARLSMPPPAAPAPPPPAPPSEGTNDVDLGGFKAGLRAAKTKIQKVPVSETESDEEDQVGAPVAAPAAPAPPPPAPPSKDTNNFDLGGFKAGLRAAKSKIQKVPVSETESDEEGRVGAPMPAPAAPAPPPPAPPSESTNNADLGGFKAGLRAAKTKIQKVPVSETDSEEEAPMRSPAAAPPQEVTSDVYLDGFKAGIQAAKTKTQKAPVSETDSESDNEQGPTIHEATKSGDLQKVRKILSKTTTKKDSVDERGWAPVHIAAAGGHTDIIKWLAVTNANLNVETPTSYTAMHLAAMHGHTNTMIVLFAMGAKLASKTVEQQSPLHVAAAGGHLETVKWLVANRAPFDTTDLLGRMPIDLAKEQSHHDVADFLRSCQQEQERPGSGLSLIRSNSKQSLSSDKEDGSHGRALAHYKPASTKYATDSDSTDSEDSDPGWRNDHSNRPTTSMGMRGSSQRNDTETESKTESKTEIKHDEELMEKRQIYDNQMRRMSEKNVSFLDAIRDEVG